MGTPGSFVSRGGALVTSLGNATSQLVWLGRDGVTRPILKELRAYSHPRLSPDGRRVTFGIADAQGTDVWLFDLHDLDALQTDLRRSPPSRRPGRPTARPSSTSPTHRMANRRSGRKPPTAAPPRSGWRNRSAYRRRWKCRRMATRSSTARGTKTHGTSTRFVSTRRARAGLSSHRNTPRRKRRIRRTEDGLRLPRTSPAEMKCISGRSPIPVARLQVSAGGGATPRWSSDGKVLYYEAGDSMVAAKLAMGPDDPGRVARHDPGANVPRANLTVRRRVSTSLAMERAF